MRHLIASLALLVGIPVYAQITKQLSSPPPGATLPVLINQTLKPHNVRPNQPVTALLIQAVPISADATLPRGAKLEGQVVSVSAGSISILFNQLSWKGQAVPVRVRLVAAASPNDVYETRLPLGATDRGTSNPVDWTTRQIGGDEIYLSGGSGKVYDQYSQPVGFANFSGVFASPSAPGNLPRAVGPFSTTATGLHGFPELSVASSGDDGKPITLAASQPNWQIGNGSALLLKVIP
jgi:hypothetical protein